MEWDRGGLGPSEVPAAAPAVGRGVAVEDFLPEAALRRAHPVVLSGHRGEIADHENNIRCRFPLANEAYHARSPILEIDPLKSGPLKIKFVIEGEEEIGSPNLGRFAAENRELVQDADGCLWEFGGKDIHGRPTLTCGLKGIFYVELHAHGANRDLHSSLAAIVEDPAWRLVWALNSLKDRNDRILIEGYYDHVEPPSALEVQALERIPFDEKAELENYGLSHFINDLHGLALLKKWYYEPTCTICGVYSGYIGEGSKTVLPNHAFAKIDFRLVPGLTPQLVLQLLRAHLHKQGFDDIEVREIENGEEVARSPLDSEIVQAAANAARATYGQEPVIYPISAGSGPMYVLCQAFGIPAVSAGCGYHDSRAHAPNENIRLTDYFEGIQFIRELIKQFAA